MMVTMPSPRTQSQVGVAGGRLQFTASVRECMKRLNATGAPLMAFGQTVLWDEPVKAVACLTIAQLAPSLKVIAGVHDTDYFSKLAGGLPSEGFAIVPHDEGATSGLWAAIAEVSSLFGAEVPLSRSKLASAGIPLRRLAAEHPDGERAFYEKYTAAYGWRGVVYGAERNLAACEVRASKLTGPLIELLDWAVADTARCLADGGQRERALAVMGEIRQDLARAAGSDPQRGLSAMYTELMATFYSRLVGRRCPHLTTAHSCQHFRFNADTCGLPRFDALGLFLSPRTADACRRAYDRAVAGSGIYPLERFGPGAIPFDVVSFGRGRGTIRIEGRHAVVQMPGEPVRCRAGSKIETRADLAAALQAEFGPEVVVVGKAVALPLMFCRDGPMLLHEGASVYVPRTFEMVRSLTQAGIELELHPVVRLSYSTWDSMAEVDTKLRLPRHLAAAFGAQELSSRELAARWRKALREAEEFVAECTDATKPADLLELLARRGYLPEGLRERFTEVASARRESGRQIQALKQEQRGRLARIRALRARLGGFHAATEAERREARRELRQAESDYEAHAARIRELVASEAHRDLQRRYQDLRREMALARLEAVSDAMRVHTLEHANRRPSWWWFPALDPSGRWFQRVAATAEMRLEEFPT